MVSAGGAGQEAVEPGRVPLRDSSLAGDILALRASVASSVMGHRSTVTVEVSQLRSPSSVAVGALLSARRRCRVRGIPFSVQGAQGPIRQAMLRCGLVETRGLLREQP